jgi:hypothetical protein
MKREGIEQIVDYLVRHALEALDRRAEHFGAELDYVAIFSKDDQEFDELVLCVEKLGTEVDYQMRKTGVTFHLAQPIMTEFGDLKLLKIRKPDPTRPQRGAPDFVIQNYDEFKQKYLYTSGNFTLMFHTHTEMIELKGVDVLVYLKSRSLVGELGLE